MFKIPKAMQIYWLECGKPKVSLADSMRIESTIGSTLPAPYVEFITQYGFVVFGRDFEKRYHFDYAIVYPDRTEIHEGNIRFLLQTEPLLIAYETLTTTEFDDDEDFPKFPRNYLPVGNDAGMGQILLELGEHPGRVWYWPFNEWAWGIEDNTWLGFVADDFYGFINQLRP
jgi:hypothetical protein